MAEISIRNMSESLWNNFRSLFNWQRSVSPRPGVAHPGLPIRDYADGDWLIAAALSSVYTKAATSRREFLREFEKIKPFYLVQGLLNAVVEDALTPDITTGEILHVQSADSRINSELEKLQRKFNLDQIVLDLAFELLSNGEFTLRMEVEEKNGVVDIIDDIDQSRVVAYYQQGYPYRFIRQTERDLEVYAPYHYAHFCLGTQKLRVRLENEFTEVSQYRDRYGDNYPAYARVGRPILYGVIAKIKELMVLEQLIPASKLNQLLTGSLIGVSVPPSMDPNDAFNVARRYEQVLNRQVGVDRGAGELSVVDILSVAGKIRALPVFGDRGQLSNLNEVKDNRNVDDLMNTIRDIREVVCTSIGFPPEIMFGATSYGGKADMLKRYARYLRRLKSAQTCFAMGVRQICMAHLVNMGIKCEVSDIDVLFRNELVNIDELEKLEFVDAVVGMVVNVNRFVTDLSADERTSTFLNNTKYQAWLYRILCMTGKDTSFINPPDGQLVAGIDPAIQLDFMAGLGEPPDTVQPTPSGFAGNGAVRGDDDTQDVSASANGTRRRLHRGSRNGSRNGHANGVAHG